MVKRKEVVVVPNVEVEIKPVEVKMARTMSEQRIREKLEKLEAQMEAEKNRLLSLKNANVDPTKLVGWSEMRQMVYQWHQEHRVPYVKVLEALVKEEMGDGYVLKISKPRGPRGPRKAKVEGKVKAA